MIGALVLAALSLGPADTPTEPIDEALVAMLVQTSAAEPVCDAYGEIVLLLDGFGLDAETEAVLLEMVDGYLVTTLEGDTLRLSPEARDVFTDWLHLACSY